MLIKFFKTKNGGSIAGIDYLLNHRVQDKTSRVLKGSESITRSIVKNIDKKQKLCMGCLSFEEKDISLDKKQIIIDEFESLIFGNYRDRYNILWVEHIDKGRLELNFAIPKIDLVSKLAFNPYFYKQDFYLLDTWQNYINLRFNFSDPKDPSKSHILQGSRKDLNLVKNYIELESILTTKLTNGEFSCRNDILKALNDSNIEVTRVGKEYISIKLSNSKRSRRFKGDMFNEKFRSIESLEQLRINAEARAKEFKDTRNETENTITKNSNSSFKKRSLIFEEYYTNRTNKEFRTIKFKQELSRRDKELNKLKAKLNKQIQKRDIWLKEQCDRKSRKSRYIKDSSLDIISSTDNVNKLECIVLSQKQRINVYKSKNAILYKQTYQWKTVRNKHKIFNERINDDITRRNIIRRIRDKRETREKENRVIKQAITRVGEFAKTTRELRARAKEFKEGIRQFQTITTILTNSVNKLYEHIERTIKPANNFTKQFSVFARTIDTIKQLSREVIRRIRKIALDNQKTLDDHKTQAVNNNKRSDSWCGIKM